jgi:hypothetical protein
VLVLKSAIVAEQFLGRCTSEFLKVIVFTMTIYLLAPGTGVNEARLKV